LNYLVPANNIQPYSPQFLSTVFGQYSVLLSALEKVGDSKVVQPTDQKLKDEIKVWQPKWMSAKLKNACETIPTTATHWPHAVQSVTQMFIISFSLQILVTLPASVASTERTFSTLRRLKA
jgi:hypothetical protein